MIEPVQKEFTLTDDTEVQVLEQSVGCFQFMLVKTDGKDDTSTWDEGEAKEVLGITDFSSAVRRRNQPFQERWKEI
jgi:hypothetical protein